MEDEYDCMITIKSVFNLTIKSVGNHIEFVVALVQIMCNVFAIFEFTKN